MDYNCDPPFNPSEKYPEYPFKSISKKENSIYKSVRATLYMLGMDKENYNRDSWNPFGGIIRPGDNVLIKPNLARNYNLAGGLEQLITHGSIIRAVLDYVCIALSGKGNITIGDAPVQDGDFNEIIKLIGLDKIVDFHKKNSNIILKLVDFRRERGYKGKFGCIVKREMLESNIQGHTPVDLKEDSELFEIISDYKKFRVTQYNKDEMIEHHNQNKNEYLISNSALNADVIINLPKLKSHRKAGMTCSLKNLIGINGSKDWLPHHRVGPLEEGGDEYLHKCIRKSALTRLIEKMDTTTNNFNLTLMGTLHFLINATRVIYPYKDPYFEGSWYGNDTIPRTITDLNKIVFYADKKGILKDNVQRKMFILVDAIIAGEKEGPLNPSPKKMRGICSRI